MIKGSRKTVHIIMPVEFYDLLAEKAEETCRTVPGYILQVLKGREPPVDGPSGGVVPGKAE